MRFTKKITRVLALAATAAFATVLSAQTLQVLTAGSSAQFGPFAVAAYALATANNTTAYHYTVKSGTCTSGSTTCYAYLADSRSSSIVNEPGNLWVVWSSNGIWAYLSVDSTVGVRAFQATPRATLGLATQSSLPVSSTSNYLYWNDSSTDTALTTTVYNALNGTAITAANTDIRPEDALFATNRALNTLGYGSVSDTRSGHTGQYLIGYGIKSAFGSGVANPVSFALSGTDPFSGDTVPTSVTIPIGAAPVVFLANAASGSVTASATNITSANAGELFSGTNCDSSMLGLTSGTAINPILREPLSGTMNTVQYSVFWSAYDQENSITGGAPGTTVAGSNNPLYLPCAAGNGYRYRAIGTGDEVKAVQDAEKVTNGAVVPNAVGYAFFSYESTAPSSSSPYHYLTLGGVDPINSSYTAGALPTCNANTSAYLNCPVSGGSSFPHLRDGSYPAWSVYRLITDSTGKSNAQTLVTEAQALVNSTIPDFVPFKPQCATEDEFNEGYSDDPGLTVYREHYVPSTITSIPNSISITANDGPATSGSLSCAVSGNTLPYLTLGGQDSTGNNTEAGGDVGGTIVGPFSSTPTAPGYTQTSTH
jgi:hypothetical protein